MKMKRFVSGLLAVLMILSMGITAMANEKTTAVKNLDFKRIDTEKSSDSFVLNSEEEPEIWYFEDKIEFSGEDQYYYTDMCWSTGYGGDFALIFDEEVDISEIYAEISGNAVLGYDIYEIWEEEPWEPVEGTCVYVLCIYIDANRTAKYKEGSITVYAGDKKGCTLNFVNDVPIIDPETVKIAGGSRFYLNAGQDGISSYYYETKGEKVEKPEAFAVTAEAFAAIEGLNLNVGIVGYPINVLIDSVQNGQQGVNFYAVAEFNLYDENNVALDEPYYRVQFFDKTPILGDYQVNFIPYENLAEMRTMFNKDHLNIVSYYSLRNYIEIVNEIRVDYSLADTEAPIGFSYNEKDSNIPSYMIKTNVDYVDKGTDYDGRTGELTVDWEVDREGTLTISGEGAIFGGSFWISGVSIIPGITSAPWWRYYEIVDEIVIEEGITAMWGTMFGFSKVSKITLPESLKSTNGELYYGMNVKTVGPKGGGYDIEYSWKNEIPNYAFQAALNIEEVTIASGIEYIGKQAFGICPSLEKVIFEGDAPEVLSAEMSTSSFDAETVTLYYPASADGWTTPTWNGYKTAPYGASTKVEITSAKIRIGKTGTVSVNVPENLNAAAIQFILNYDANVLEVESVTAGVASDALINANTPGEIVYVWEGLEPINSAGSLMDIVFKAKEDIDPQTVTVDFNKDEDLIFVNGDLEEIDIKLVSGKIDIIDVIFGDVNEDEKVNVLDANIVRRYAARLVELTDSQIVAADVDGNGKINVLDANYIRRYAAKIITQFPAELL